jgi:hypothetical protein
VQFSFSMFFSVFCPIPVPIVCISHFLCFSVFFVILQVLECAFLIFHVFQFSCPIPGPTVCVSHFPHFSVFLTIFQVLHCAFLLKICLTIFSFLTIFQVLECMCLIFHVFYFSHHIQGPTVCVSHFHVFHFSRHNQGPRVCISHIPNFSVFLTILQFLQCAFLKFPSFSVFSPFSRSYSVNFSFSMFFSVSYHISGLPECISQFPCF